MSSPPAGEVVDLAHGLVAVLVLRPPGSSSAEAAVNVLLEESPEDREAAATRRRRQAVARVRDRHRSRSDPPAS